MIAQFSPLCEPPVLPALPAADCMSGIKFSQIKAIILKPKGAKGPTDWTSAAAWANAIDNTDTAGEFSKYLTGIGEVSESEDVRFSLGKRSAKVARRLAALDFELKLLESHHEDLLNEFQKSWAGFRFWFYTLSEILYGGPLGICPSFASGVSPHNGGAGDLKFWRLRIEWPFHFEGDREDVNIEPRIGVVFGPTPTVLEDDDGSLLMDSEGNVLGFF